MLVLTTGTIVNITTEHWPPPPSGYMQAWFVVLDAATNQYEYFILWGLQDGTYEFAPLWMERSLNVSLLREALVSGLQVGVVHDDTSSFAVAVEVGSYIA